MHHALSEKRLQQEKEIGNTTNHLKSPPNTFRFKVANNGKQTFLFKRKGIGSCQQEVFNAFHWLSFNINRTSHLKRITTPDELTVEHR